MPGDLQGRVALVTGGARRIGAAIALALGRAGAGVVLHYRESRDAAEALAADLRGLGVAAHTVAGDLSVPEEAEGLVAAATAVAGPLDLLVNNASIFPSVTIDDMTPEQLHENINVNALAPFLVSRAFARQGRPGSIVNLLDTRIASYDRNHLAYYLSKQMLDSMTRAAALEYAPGIRVNGVAPGLILPPAGEGADYLARLAGTNPLHRTGAPEDIAEAVLFLFRSPFITGEVIYVDGGRHLRGTHV